VAWRKAASLNLKPLNDPDAPFRVVGEGLAPSRPSRNAAASRKVTSLSSL
jgi:hypothetical protein